VLADSYAVMALTHLAHWNLAPQQRVYCPAPWLRRGANEIIVLDLHQSKPAPIAGRETLTD
jgi:beta-galactosidase